MNAKTPLPESEDLSEAEPLRAEAALASGAVPAPPQPSHLSGKTPHLTSTLRHLGVALQAGAELEETLQAVCDLAAQIMDASSAIIRLVDPQHRLVARAVTGDATVQALRSLTFALDDSPLSAVLQTRKALTVPAFNPEDSAFPDELRAVGIRNFLSVPILSSNEDHVLGTLTVHNKRNGPHFDREDEAVLSAFAAHASVAVEKAVLREEQRLVEEEVRILHDVTSAMTSLHLSVVLQLTIEHVKRLVDVQRCGIFLYNPARGTLTASEACGSDTWRGIDFIGKRIALPRADPLYNRLSDGVPVDLPDFNIPSPAQDALLSALSGDFHVAIPMLNQQHLVGIIALTPQADAAALGERECRILASIGRQIAPVVENARLYEEAERRVMELSALQRISQVLAASVETREMLDTVLTEVVTLMNADCGSIMLYHPDKGTLKVEAAYGLPSKAFRREVPLGAGVAGWVALRREPLHMSNVNGDSRFTQLLPRPEIRSAIVAPLLSKRQLLGVLSISHNHPDWAYTNRDLSLIRTMAASIAVAIENARHYDSEREIAQIARVALLPSISPSIPGVEIGQKHMPALEVGGDYYTVFELEPGKIGILVSDVSGRSVYAAMHAAVGKHFIRALSHRSHDPAEVLRHANTLIYQETPEEIFISAFYGILDIPTGRLSYANAGHVSPFLLRAEGVMEELPPTGMLLGLWDTMNYENSVTILGRNETLFCYTDGVTEAKRERDRELFGEERLKAILNRQWGKSAQGIVDAVFRRTLAFCGRRNDDDLALLAIRRTYP